MLESGADAVRRYAPPSQRNRVVNRKKSEDRIEKVNHPLGIDGERSRASYSTSLSAIDHGEAGSSINHNANTHLGLIPLDGCSISEAAQLLNERWMAAMHICNDPSTNLSEKPIVYSGASGSSWGHFKLPHQMDFLGELHRAIHSQSSDVPTAGDHN